MGLDDISFTLAVTLYPLGFGARHVARPRLAQAAYTFAALALCLWAIEWDIHSLLPLPFRVLGSGLVGAFDAALLTIALADTLRRDANLKPESEGDNLPGPGE